MVCVQSKNSANAERRLRLQLRSSPRDFAEFGLISSDDDQNGIYYFATMIAK